eukprot:CAMPEP_0184482352 /NCGR_PEP_ID=MMETSP0113_2-20130426/3911_1 /TAXON_ID=91329 /ORGANISM="Norrisiella sphaerica, Strain BC52" /LENGTH=303 /DNA_ID=CAMNT_0026862027 /DNA_START=128 /DNA_END=1039 /DNA_ORIENTATION=+
MVGAWRRPLFAGGWTESTEQDTIVFNLQSPSLFIDIRFPLKRPDFSKKSGYEDLSMDELRCLSRQHTFAGYTKAEPKDGSGFAPVATRHHALDWNYHPKFPRERPNRWRFQLKEDGTSFKEFSVAFDPHNQAVYMERWGLYPKGRGPYLALRREIHGEESESLFVVVGNHFAFARDRKHPLPSFPSAKSGGCANLVDAAYHQGDREKMTQMVNLEGSYGHVRDENGALTWKIMKSTVPWREGKPLLVAGDFKLNVGSNNGVPPFVSFLGARWRVFECSFSVDELHTMFMVAGGDRQRSLKSRL